jgi:hypothetical protein
MFKTSSCLRAIAFTGAFTALPLLVLAQDDNPVRNGP